MIPKSVFRPTTALTAIDDLDTVLQSIRKEVPRSIVWQRRLHAHMDEADRQVEVLRLTLLLRRDQSEVATAAEELQAVLRRAQSFVLACRADIVTKTAVQMVVEFGKRVSATIASTTRDAALPAS